MAKMPFDVLKKVNNDEYIAEIRKNAAGEWYWSLRSVANGQTVAISGEGYKKRKHAVEMVDKLWPTQYLTTEGLEPLVAEIVEDPGFSNPMFVGTDGNIVPMEAH